MINLSNVTVQFNGNTVLDDISLQVKPGDFVFLVGLTGCGKSTILKLMYMDLLPTKGTVTVGPYSAENIERKEKPYLRRTLGIIFQDFRFQHVRWQPQFFRGALHGLFQGCAGINHSRHLSVLPYRFESHSLYAIAPPAFASAFVREEKPSNCRAPALTTCGA